MIINRTETVVKVTSDRKRVVTRVIQLLKADDILKRAEIVVKATTYRKRTLTPK